MVLLEPSALARTSERHTRQRHFLRESFSLALLTRDRSFPLAITLVSFFLFRLGHILKEKITRHKVGALARSLAVVACDVHLTLVSKESEGTIVC